jgi:hypothetical protein
VARHGLQTIEVSMPFTPGLAPVQLRRVLVLVPSILTAALLTIGTADSLRPVDSGVARIERVLGDVGVARAGGSEAAVAGVRLRRHDRITTGDASRAAIAFPDGSRLLIGSNTQAVVEDFQPESGRRRTTLMLEVTGGPFRLQLSAVGRGQDKRVVVRTEEGTYLVKSRDLWSGPLDGATGVLSIAGSVQVRTDGGFLVLDRKRQGTMLRGHDATPDAPDIWPHAKIERALIQVAFD